MSLVLCCQPVLIKKNVLLKLAKPTKKINKENPRVYALEASLQYHMPVMFGGGCAKSYAIALIASEKLNAQAKLNTHFYMPHWGINVIQEIIDKCK